ncbi:MAG: primosomal protein N' [Parachlamydiales bacterium]
MEELMPDAQKIIFAEVILDSAIDRPLDYQIPDHLQSSVQIGSRVMVPLRGAHKAGTVFSLKETSPFSKVQPIIETLSEEPLISAELFQLARWMSRYYCAPFRKVLKSILPPSIRGKIKHKEQLLIESPLSQNLLAAECEALRQKNPSHASILDIVLKAPKGILLSELLEKADVSRSPIDTLIKKKLLCSRKVQIERSALSDEEYFPTKPKRLNEEQTHALARIKESLSEARFEAQLLFGVTGSGKTEVYLQAMEHALTLNKGVIFLVPEIALTSQTIERLRSRFKEKIAVLHHRLSEGERHDAWHQIHQAKAPIVIGARSAIFSPVPRLGLIIVDEEQESSYKQTEESPSYHARDVAVMRAKLSNATVVLGSATPSFESYQNALTGKYRLSTLKQRADSAQLPEIQIVDMQVEFQKAKSFTLFSEPLINEMKKRLEIGEQTILFLNRRGYHTSQMCPRCSHVIECPHCDVSLTFHLNENILACHLCDYRLSPPPRTCPNCKSEEGLKFKGAGTEMVERALHAILPEVRTLRLDADTTRHKGSHEMLFKQFRSGKADVLIGTQMIAKGLHFPSVTLVGVLNADGNLQIPDFRASEQVFQLITQVSGRSGRGAMAGKVIIQTRMPEHPVMALAANQNYEEFFSQEIEVRKLFTYPPFSHLIKLTFSSEVETLCRSTAQKFRETLISSAPPHCEVLPIVPCGHAKVKGRHRFQFLIKAEKFAQLLQTIDTLRQDPMLPQKVRLSIDVDPLSTFF